MAQTKRTAFFLMAQTKRTAFLKSSPPLKRSRSVGCWGVKMASSPLSPPTPPPPPPPETLRGSLSSKGSPRAGCLHCSFTHLQPSRDAEGPRSISTDTPPAGLMIRGPFLLSP
ncbi:hypothetical protein LIER_44100 [Lithospermum erythrorhizon]|uniref:Uncharacterized protein n=1 Tax=Lithospermum erythrorhizon TaxID=34254 RepID=A0AAV3PHZ3_LITER